MTNKHDIQILTEDLKRMGKLFHKAVRVIIEQNRRIEKLEYKLKEATGYDPK
jgi:hypothetical protein